MIKDFVWNKDTMLNNTSFMNVCISCRVFCLSLQSIFFALSSSQIAQSHHYQKLHYWVPVHSIIFLDVEIRSDILIFAI